VLVEGLSGKESQMASVLLSIRNIYMEREREREMGSDHWIEARL
jgi:hypothetical protein